MSITRMVAMMVVMIRVHRMIAVSTSAITIPLTTIMVTTTMPSHRVPTLSVALTLTSPMASAVVCTITAKMSAALTLTSAYFLYYAYQHDYHHSVYCHFGQRYDRHCYAEC